LTPLERNRRLRVAALVDLPRSAQAGGHVKWWERLAAAAAREAERDNWPLDLTVYFSGDGREEILGPHVRLRSLRPVFSTTRLKFLPYVPDHTDLSPYHPALARQLPQYDLIHTTDAFFAFARTAERVARRHRIALTTSFHTDTPAYARLFTRQTIDQFARWPWLKRKLIEDWRFPERQGARMDRLLQRHLRACAHAFVTRAEDQSLAEGILGPARVSLLRVGIDKAMFGPQRRDVAGVRRDYAISGGSVVALFVGRVDVGKNVQTLLEAAGEAIAAGTPLHLIVAGVGPMMAALRERLGGHVSLPGFVEPDELARLYASVDFVAAPSEVEVGSMAAIEAIASGCPALVARGSGSATLLDHMPAIRAVESGAAAWTMALSDLARDAKGREQMREAALDYRASRLASWSEVLNEDLLNGWQAALAGG
jgi:glycosyltransferase involved in cell wall biosynthesis